MLLALIVRLLPIYVIVIPFLLVLDYVVDSRRVELVFSKGLLVSYILILLSIATKSIVDILISLFATTKSIVVIVDSISKLRSTSSISSELGVSSYLYISLKAFKLVVVYRASVYNSY